MKEIFNIPAAESSQPTLNVRALYQTPQLEHLQEWVAITGIPITVPVTSGRYWFDGDFWSENDPWSSDN
jgi:hypothetical protein